MAANQLIIVEIVTAIEILCRQVNTMMTLTGRQCPNDKLQNLINNRVEEFKLLYTEIPIDSKFTIGKTVANVLFIISNQVFRDYAEAVEKEFVQAQALEERQQLGVIKSLH